jgi:hypothetical protein
MRAFFCLTSPISLIAQFMRRTEQMILLLRQKMRRDLYRGSAKDATCVFLNLAEFGLCRCKSEIKNGKGPVPVALGGEWAVWWRSRRRIGRVPPRVSEPIDVSRPRIKQERDQGVTTRGAGRLGNLPENDRRHGTSHPGYPPLPSCRRMNTKNGFGRARSPKPGSSATTIRSVSIQFAICNGYVRGSRAQGLGSRTEKAPLRSSHWSGRPNNHLIQRV